MRPATSRVSERRQISSHNIAFPGARETAAVDTGYARHTVACCAASWPRSAGASIPI